MNSPRDLQKGVLASIGVHIILLLLTLLITVEMEPEAREYAELSFAHLTTRLQLTPPPPEEAPSVPEKGIRPDEPATPVELPRMRSMDEREILPVSVPDKLGPDEGVEEAQRPGVGEKERLGEVAIGEEKRGLPSEIPGEREGPQFTIEGPLAGRAAISKVIPKYPPGHQKEVVVKAKLMVLPSGVVSEVIPLRKGDPILEELTVKALSQWKFSPLPPDLPQVPQEGKVTFIYRLR